MTDKIIFDLIRNSSSPLTLVKCNGDIIFNSRVFDSFVADKMPYEGNFLDMLANTEDRVVEIETMVENNKIEPSKFPQNIKVNNNNLLKLTLNSTFSINNEELYLLELHNDTYILDSFTKDFIESENLFVKKKINLLVYDSSNSRIIAFNNSTQDYVKSNNLKNNQFPESFENSINELVEKAKIGGISSEKYNLVVSDRDVVFSFECSNIDVNHNYFLVSFVDDSDKSRIDEISALDKERAHNIIDIVPGILFEFEMYNSTLKFTYISESVKDLIGLSSKHILNDSSKLFGYLHKRDRARLHYFFTALTEEERKIRNEFMIKDHENKARWVTINWHETYSINGNIKGTGYIDDITEKKKNQIKKLELEKRRELKNYFSISLLKHNSISSLLSDLAKTVVKKLFLQDIAIYLYNSDSRTLNYATSFSAIDSGGTRFTYPKEIPIDKGIIGRVVNSQKSEIINYSSDDSDYYFIDKPSESEITVPIIFEGELLGVIDSEHIKPNFFNNEHLHFLEDISESLAIRLVQKKRQDDNLKFHSTLSLLYNQGKIFDFNYDLETNIFNDSCIDNFIYLLGINDTSSKIEIYNDSRILLNYVLQYDIEKLIGIKENLKNSIVKDDEISFRIITELGFIKWLKITISNSNKDENGKILTIDGTIQEVTKLKELESKSEDLENLEALLKILKKQLEKDRDIEKSISLIGKAINVFEIAISKYESGSKQKWINHKNWKKTKEGVGENEIENSIFKLSGFDEKIKSNLSIEMSNFDKIEMEKMKGLPNFISIPIKNNSGLWGVITFIENNKKQKWKDYQKALMIVYTNLISIYIK